MADKYNDFGGQGDKNVIKLDFGSWKSVYKYTKGELYTLLGELYDMWTVT